MKLFLVAGEPSGDRLGAALMARGATGRDGPLSKLTELSDKPTRSTSQGVY